jgi:hypothetical protein
MCMLVFAAADTPLPLLSDAERAPLNARLPEGREERVRQQFSKHHVVFLGSHTGCSCGFSYGHSDDPDVEGRQSVGALGRYLAQAVDRAGPVEVFACWEGDEGRAVAESVIVTPAFFTADAASFELTEGWLATVVRPAT